MSFLEAMKMFNYSKAVQELGLSSDSLWEELYARSCSPSPEEQLSSAQLEELQALHDLSWVLTQVDADSRSMLEQLAGRVENTLKERYGPYIFEFCHMHTNFSLEGLLLPLAKLLDEEVEENFLLLLLLSIGISPQQFRIPPEKFVVCFAEDLLNDLVQKLPRQPIPPGTRGRRLPTGHKASCAMCNGAGIDEAELQDLIRQIRLQARRAIQQGPPSQVPNSVAAQLVRFLQGNNGCFRCHGTGLDLPALVTQMQGEIGLESIPDWVYEKFACRDCFGNQNWQAGLRVPLPANPRSTLEDLLSVLFSKSTSGQELRNVLGENVFCKSCTYWLVIPAEAQAGWVCPVVDASGETLGWVRIE